MPRSVVLTHGRRAGCQKPAGAAKGRTESCSSRQSDNQLDAELTHMDTNKEASRGGEVVCSAASSGLAGTPPSGEPLGLPTLPKHQSGHSTCPLKARGMQGGTQRDEPECLRADLVPLAGRSSSVHQLQPAVSARTEANAKYFYSDDS